MVMLTVQYKADQRAVSSSNLQNLKHRLYIDLNRKHCELSSKVPLVAGKRRDEGVSSKPYLCQVEKKINQNRYRDRIAESYANLYLVL